MGLQAIAAVAPMTPRPPDMVKVCAPILCSSLSTSSLTTMSRTAPQ